MWHSMNTCSYNKFIWLLLWGDNSIDLSIIYVPLTLNLIIFIIKKTYITGISDWINQTYIASYYGSICPPPQKKKQQFVYQHWHHYFSHKIVQELISRMSFCSLIQEKWSRKEPSRMSSHLPLVLRLPSRPPDLHLPKQVATLSMTLRDAINFGVKDQGESLSLILLLKEFCPLRLSLVIYRNWPFS